MSFKLTYSTMFNPPAEMHARFEQALAEVTAMLEKKQALFIDGEDIYTQRNVALHSPVNHDWILGYFPAADRRDVNEAVQAAKEAFQSWRKTTPSERIACLRRVAQKIEERVYHIAAALCLEVGKNRMEALGEAQETADFFWGYCDSFLANENFDHVMPQDPLSNCQSHNRSIMKPYGVWAVLTPYNFPFALAGGPVAAALVTGNTVVLKGSSATPWAGRLLADCVRDAGLPAGVFNYLSGSSSEIGDVLTHHPDIAGMTFTGSHAIGMKLLRHCSANPVPRPCIAEMGGKNACIVSEHADLDRAADGIFRSAFGLSGQKCSALSRLYCHEKVADALLAKLTEKINAVVIGNSTQKDCWMGPLTTAAAYADYKNRMALLDDAHVRILAGGKLLAHGAYDKGYFVTPVLLEAPLAHPWWREEMFLPILMCHRVRSNEEAMQLANDCDMGLTAGFYGSDAEVVWFFEHIEAGVVYANRPQGATTGAWPGYQAFGGWKGSGSTGKAIGSFYYLAQYMREQSQTRVD